MALFTGEGRLILNGRNQQISDCEFSGAGIHAKTAAHLIIDNVKVESGDPGIWLEDVQYAYLRNCRFELSETGLFVDAGYDVQVDSCYFEGTDAISTDRSTSLRISNCHVEISGAFLSGEGDNDQLVVEGNVIYAREGIVGGYAEQTIIRGNHLLVAGGTQLRAIELIAPAEGYEVVIADNICDGGRIHVEGVNGAFPSHGLTIHDNTVLEPGDAHGIHIVDCERASVHHNTVVSSTPPTDDTYDGIHVDDQSSGCLVDHNQIVTATGQLRHGIYAPAGNQVVGNNLGASADYGTSPIGGSPTIAYPNDATNGDNFVS